MTMAEFRSRLDELLKQAEEELPPDEVLSALEEWAEVERGDLLQLERYQRVVRRWWEGMRRTQRGE
jgi:hypothetical protein